MQHKLYWEFSVTYDEINVSQRFSTWQQHALVANLRVALIIAFLKLRERGRRTRASRLVLLFSALSASSWNIVEGKFMKSKGGRVVRAEEIQGGNTTSH